MKCFELARIAELPWNHPIMGNTLSATYARYGMVSKVCQMPNKIPIRDVVSWNAIMMRYA